MNTNTTESEHFFYNQNFICEHSAKDGCSSGHQPGLAVQLTSESRAYDSSLTNLSREREKRKANIPEGSKAEAQRAQANWLQQLNQSSRSLLSFPLHLNRTDDKLSLQGSRLERKQYDYITVESNASIQSHQEKENEDIQKINSVYHTHQERVLNQLKPEFQQFVYTEDSLEQSQPFEIHDVSADQNKSDGVLREIQLDIRKNRRHYEALTDMRGAAFKKELRECTFNPKALKQMFQKELDSPQDQPPSRQEARYNLPVTTINSSRSQSRSRVTLRSTKQFIQEQETREIMRQKKIAKLRMEKERQLAQHTRHVPQIDKKSRKMAIKYHNWESCDVFSTTQSKRSASVRPKEQVFQRLSGWVSKQDIEAHKFATQKPKGGLRTKPMKREVVKEAKVVMPKKRVVKRCTSAQPRLNTSNHLYELALTKQAKRQEDHEKRNQEYEEKRKRDANSKKMTLNSQKYYVSRMTKELIKIWQSLDLDATSANNETMSSANMTHILAQMGFIIIDKKTDDFEEQEHLIELLWRSLGGQERGHVTLNNLRMILLGIQSIYIEHGSNIERTELKPLEQSQNVNQDLNDVDEDPQRQLAEELGYFKFNKHGDVFLDICDVKSIQRVFKLFNTQRVTFELTQGKCSYLQKAEEEKNLLFRPQISELSRQIAESMKQRWQQEDPSRSDSAAKYDYLSRSHRNSAWQESQLSHKLAIEDQSCTFKPKITPFAATNSNMSSAQKMRPDSRITLSPGSAKSYNLDKVRIIKKPVSKFVELYELSKQKKTCERADILSTEEKQFICDKKQCTFSPRIKKSLKQSKSLQTLEIHAARNVLEVKGASQLINRIRRGAEMKKAQEEALASGKHINVGVKSKTALYAMNYYRTTRSLSNLHNFHRFENNFHKKRGQKTPREQQDPLKYMSNTEPVNIVTTQMPSRQFETPKAHESTLLQSASSGSPNRTLTSAKVEPSILVENNQSMTSVRRKKKKAKKQLRAL